MSSASHTQPLSKAMFRRHLRNRAWSISTAASGVEEPVDDEGASTASASLRIVWQGEQDWEDEFQDLHLGGEDEQWRINRSVTPSGISELSAFRNLEKMFHRRDEEGLGGGDDDLLDRTLTLGGNQTTEWLGSSSVCGEEEQGSSFGLSSRLNDSSYMYHSVTVERGDIAPSMCGSTRSNLSGLRAKASQGLWELTSSSSRHSTPEKSTFPRRSEQTEIVEPRDRQKRVVEKNQMTDSCLSKTSFASSSGSTSSKRCGNAKMFDSAIADMGELLPAEGAQKSPGVMRRNWLLDEIEESPRHAAGGDRKKSRRTDSSVASRERDGSGDEMDWQL